MNRTDTFTKATYSPRALAYRPASNTLKVRYETGAGVLVLYYSYQTCIGFVDNGHGVYTGRRYSVTTSKHQGFMVGDMHQHEGAAGRFDATPMAGYERELTVLSDPEFRAALSEAVLRHGLPYYTGRGGRDY